MTNAATLGTTERRLGAQRLAQYVARSRCERYLRFSLFPSEADALFARFGVAQEPLSPLLSAAGQQFEREQVARLAAVGTVHDMKARSAAEFVEAVAGQPDGRVFYDQPHLTGPLGPWECDGRADLVGVERDGDGVAVRIVDVKASRRETVGYRLQVAFYARLLRQAFAEAGIRVTRLDGAVAALDAESAVDAPPFELGIYEDEIDRLVSSPGSDVERVVRKAPGAASYHLGPACDGCPYNAVCFVDTAERADLSLVPRLTATEKSALRSEGIETATSLATMFDYGDGGMLPAEGRASDVARVAARRAIGPRVATLSQRARAAVHGLDRSVEAKPYLVGSGFGSLPDDAQYPGLVKVFVDAQRDYLEDRLYMLAGVVAGPAGTEEIVEISPARPDTASERELLVAWMQRALPALGRAAGAREAPVHVYLFDRRSQRSLLDALARHFDAVCAIPAFYDLLTSRPALSQGMVSFLADEVADRMNLSPVCQNLYQVAGAMGFRWEDAAVAARTTFRARIFDNRRPFERDAAGRLRRAEEIGDETLWVESSSRFGVEVPLEYAYAAWGRLDEAAGERAKPFAGATLEDIAALGRLRCRALAHVEGRFAVKNRRVEKTPLALDRLDEVAVEPGEVPFRRALEDFLLLEHHASRQELLLHLGLGPAERSRTGRTALLRCEAFDDGASGQRARFSYSDAGGAAVDAPGEGTLKYREGDWAVLNPLAGEDGEPLSAWKLVHGRLAVVERIDASSVELRLMPMSFKNSTFRYTHRLFTPSPGTVYTLDEMLDDLNADKFLEASQNAESNHLYRWIERPEEGKQPRAIRPKRLREVADVADLAHGVQAPHGLTDAQRRVVGDHVADRVLVVQGPPGTGKSHTLGFAVLARALALATPVRPFRIAVLAKTHAASLVALESIAKRARQLLATGDARVASLAGLKLAKVCNDVSDPVPEGVERVLAGGGDDVTAPEQWYFLLQEPLLVLGGTPGGLFNLLKRGAARGGAIDWSEEHFDLVVVDEASQMGIAEALTAAAVLREDGQFVAIGDHRQMPPILAHAWDAESRRDLALARPHLAIFDYLRELGFASVALDESFRVPAEVAEFLQRHVYADDGVAFHSRNRTRLGRAEGLDGWLAAALEPEHALVVVEHAEAASQQSNEYEAALCEEIVRAATERLGLDAADGVGIVVPHSAQRALLRRRLPNVATAVDTVERFQGGERDLVVVSATVSDREFAQREAAFLLEPRRLTVAVSRPRRKLVVVASRTMFELIPSDLDAYERGALWKRLRRECGARVLWEGDVGGHAVRVLAASPC
jgi:hypothetical protein